MSEDIYRDFETRATYHRTTLLLPADAALDFVRECRKRGIELLGFEGFTLAPNDMIQPHLEHVLDLSASPFKGLSTSEKLALAEKFIEDRLHTDLVFEMVIS